MTTTPSTLRAAVCQAYSAVATAPTARHPFPVGRAFAASLGYSDELLDALPADCVASFTGCSNVSLFADLPAGAQVLDLGCGAGLDALVAAQRVGAQGHVTGADFSEAMLDRARAGAAVLGLGHLAFMCADAEQLPLADASVDRALVNGLFNLNPARAAIFAELARVLRPGGALYAAEIVLKDALPEAIVDEANWCA